MANQDGAIEATTVHEAAEAMADSSAINDLLGLEADEEVIEDTEETEDVEAVEPEEVTDETEAEESDEDAEADEEQQIETVADIAEALGVELSDLQANLKTTIKLNGVESNVTLDELKNGYQRDADYRKKTTELAETRRQIEADREARLTQLQSQAQITGMVMKKAFDALVGERAEIDKLQETDPQRWVVEVTKHNNRVQEFQAMQQQAAQAWQQHSEGISQQTQQERQARELAEREKLVSAIPDWTDNRAQEIGEYLINFGFQGPEIAEQLDHRWLVLADKARQFDGAVKAADPAAKRVRSLPKTQKPAKKAVTVKRSNFQKAARRLKQTGDRRDAGAAIANMPNIDKILNI